MRRYGAGAAVALALVAGLLAGCSDGDAPEPGADPSTPAPSSAEPAPPTPAE